MALVLNEEQTMLRDAARSFLGERAPVAHLRELRDSGKPDGFSRELWAEMTGLGWAAILVPEEYGGLAYGYTGLGLVLEETGRTLTPSPLLGTALTAVAALNLAGTDAQCAAILPGIWGVAWFHHPTIGPALAVGIGTVAAPFLVMQPGMGAGIAASRTPRPASARLQSLLMHAIFGLGLYAAGRAARFLYAP